MTSDHNNTNKIKQDLWSTSLNLEWNFIISFTKYWAWAQLITQLFLKEKVSTQFRRQSSSLIPSEKFPTQTLHLHGGGAELRFLAPTASKVWYVWILFDVSTKIANHL